ncbi:matrixin family metalloprotease [Frigoriglobus tundricola]|uniref:Peptidase metallopeptidase domain-containing protein n=1 Tax=Frigoriglobus tundricola TaxID=2774151 RepID=A0A6M5Z6P7_9BACT|nr:matrixin family metalloprotease [Frigoriglobus tundricola]QJX00903.1 hypothetical protein FTUN_8541 [Frigoriglobus tundricola]
MSQSLPPRRLSIEQLEDRLTPSFGTPWMDGTHLTLSFAPDGTSVSGRASNLFALMGSTTTQSQWQVAVLSAYQTWADAANLNIGLVSDGGQALGVAGAPQGDVRFGDIRVAARPLSAPGTPGSTMADTAGFDYNDQTWAGDLVFNSQYQFGIGDTPGVQSDLYSVALHEAGHSFGLADENTDPTSVMYAAYQGVLTGLSASDVAAIQALYGAPPADPYAAPAGGGLAGAYSLGNVTALSARITQIGGTDLYQFTTPSAFSGATGLTIDLQAAGISLFTGQVTVLDAQGNVVGSATTSDPTNNDLSVAVANYQPSSTYYIKVSGSSANVFSMGSYVLSLDYGGWYQGGRSAVNNFYTNTINSETRASDNTQSHALPLVPVQASEGNTFDLVGSISNPADVDWYRITPTLSGATSGTLFVGTMTTTHGLIPSISIYDAQGNRLPAVVTSNQPGSFEVQLANATSGTTYFIELSGMNGQGEGRYTLGATLAAAAPTTFAPTVSDTLTAADTINATQLSVSGDQLTQFALSATTVDPTAAAVRMSIFDATGELVFTLVDFTNQPLATGSVWLAAGSYTLVFNAVNVNGSTIQALALALASRSLTDPIDPYPVDPTSPPPLPLVPVSAPVPPPTAPPAPIVNAVASPLAAIPIVPPV